MPAAGAQQGQPSARPARMRQLARAAEVMSGEKAGAASRAPPDRWRRPRRACRCRAMWGMPLCAGAGRTMRTRLADSGTRFVASEHHFMERITPQPESSRSTPGLDLVSTSTAGPPATFVSAPERRFVPAVSYGAAPRRLLSAVHGLHPFTVIRGVCIKLTERRFAPTGCGMS